jgi:cell division protein FtsB
MLSTVQAIPISLSTNKLLDPPMNKFLDAKAPIPLSTQHGQISFVGTTDDLLEQAAVENEDDDYFDVQSDEEMEIPPDQTVRRLQENQRDFGMIVALHREHTSELSMRRYDTFIYAGILDHYRAEWVANPLRNPKTARVFAHFIFATGPTLSIFERRPRNSSVMFSETPVPNYQQGLWTYILPMMALNHQGLLHAMLALASLHIAKLQGASVTPSYKHYAYALKRIHHCVGNRKKRHLPTTLAATLLLGFYEVMTADHLKWSSHLAGAKQLLVEIDFTGMTREYRRLKAEKAAFENQNDLEDSETALQERNPNRTFKDLSPAIDEGLVSTLIGRKLKYDEFGRIVEDVPPPKLNTEPKPPLDTAQYELYQDLFWWYARQDVYQAIISGNRLL